MFPDTNYMSTPRNNPFHIGQRSIKTAAAATVVAMLYLIFGGNPTFACIGAIFGLGNDMSMSRLNGGNRFFGTIIGGMVGIALFRVYIMFIPDGKPTLLTLLFLFVGVVVLISCCQAFKWPGGIQPGGVVLCIILFNTPVETYISYALNRILDTGIGVLAAFFVNAMLPGGFTFRFMRRFYVWLGIQSDVDHTGPEVPLIKRKDKADGK